MASPTSSSSPADAGPRAPRSVLGWIGLSLKWLFLLFVALVVIGFVLEPYIVEIPLLLAFGWIRFFRENMETMQPNWVLIAEALACTVALGWGGHHFARWLWARMAPEGSAAWRLRWTVAGLATVLLLFVAGIATIGITHQAAWIFTDKEPFLQDSFSARARMSEVVLAGAAARTAVTEFYAEKGRLPDSAREAGTEETSPSRYVKAIRVGPKGRITIQASESVAGGGEVYLTPSVDGPQISWKCSATFPAKQMPGSCRD